MVLGVSTFLENAFPPTPSDVAVALGAFLTHSKVTVATTVFLVAWLSSAVGAVVVYSLSRKYGRTLFSGRVGRRLLSPQAIATIERGYLRFGIAGIFLGRLLPGVRSFVAPFAGMLNLSPVKALVPMILASGVWYGTLTLIGALLGSEWEHINHIIAGMNRTLGWLAVAIVLAVTITMIVRRKRRSREFLLETVTNAFGPDQVLRSKTDDERTALAAAATLLVELARADETLSPGELEMVTGYLQQRYALAAESVRKPGTGIIENAKLLEYGNRLSREYRKPERLALMQRLWKAAFGEGALREQEQRLMLRAGILLGLSEAELEAARDAARPAGPAA
ncbi:MAG: VTT domain-containing protein [Gemmatimonadota bacterium]